MSSIKELAAKAEAALDEARKTPSFETADIAVKVANGYIAAARLLGDYGVVTSA